MSADISERAGIECWVIVKLGQYASDYFDVSRN
jgi:hypothetical protein